MSRCVRLCVQGVFCSWCGGDGALHLPAATSSARGALEAHTHTWSRAMCRRTIQTQGQVGQRAEGCGRPSHPALLCTRRYMLCVSGVNAAMAPPRVPLGGVGSSGADVAGGADVAVSLRLAGGVCHSMLCVPTVKLTTWLWL